MLVEIDFETRSRTILRQAGAWRYSLDPSTQLMCASWKTANGERRGWRPDLGPPPGELLEWAADASVYFEAHNAWFEYCIWTNVLSRRLGWPHVADRRWHCTAARARAMCLPTKLDHACEAMGLPGKNAEDYKLMLAMGQPRKPTKKDPREWLDGPDLRERLFAYNGRDVDIEHALGDVTLPLCPTFERRVWLADMRVNQRGCRVDVPLVRKGQDLLKWHTAELNAELKHVTGVDRGTMREKLLAWMQPRGYRYDSLAREFLNRSLAEDHTPTMRRVIQLRWELAQSSVKKYATILKQLDPADDAIRGMLVYLGAQRTGRWAGRGVQPQNLATPKGLSVPDMCAAMERAHATRDLSKLDGFVERSLGGTTKTVSRMDVLSRAIRGMFVPRRGMRMAIGDYNAFEARIVAWVADATDLLEAFRADDRDPYREMASEVYGIPLPQIKKWPERELGKNIVLGCGYGMGANKFYDTCHKRWNLPIEMVLARKGVRLYRRKYPSVPKTWDRMEDAAKRCVSSRREQPCGHVCFEYHVVRGHHWLAMRLPSGRAIWYHGPRISRADDKIFYDSDEFGKWMPTDTWGGKFCENACQAIARDILADAFVYIEENARELDLWQLMTVHDEDVAETRASDGDKRLEHALLEVRPWARTIPLKVECKLVDRYEK